ncbi:MAG: flagellar motor switch protein FliG [Treponema sp.]|nr:flagellar motor switch protein FliG [Treponema sp.]
MGNILKHGIQMYNQTMNPEKEPPAFFKETKKAPVPPQDYDVTPSIILKQTKDAEVKSPRDSKYARVAKFLIIIGSEQASGILAELDSEHVGEISKEIALTKKITPEEKDEILAEFNDIFKVTSPYSLSGFSRGGVETARRILYAARGPEKGEELLNKAVPESKENLFTFLEEYSTEQLVMLLKEESAQTSSLILSRMPAKLSAGIISKFSPVRKADILKRIAYQGEVSPDVLEQVSAALKEKVRNIAGGSKDIKIDGMQTLAAILKQGDYSFGDRIINEIGEDDPRIGHNLKEKLYSLDDVINCVDRPVQEKLAAMTEQEIAILLKGRKIEFSEKILSCVSAGRRKLIREEFEVLGAVPKRDCDTAANEFLTWFRTARERGEIILSSDEDVFL